MQEITIIVPEKLSTNKIYTMHHFAKAKYNKDVYREVELAVRSQKIKPVTEYPAVFTYTFYASGRTLDILNVAGMAKCIEDGLRYSGVLKDDTLKHVCQVTLLEEKSDKDYSYFVVEIN